MNRSLIAQMDQISLIILFGILIVMGLVGIGLAQEHPRIFFLVDAFLLVGVFIMADFISGAYETIISNPSLNAVSTENLPNQAKFILNLPIWATLTGLLIMVFTYGLSNKIKESQAREGVQDVIGFGE